jgi:hypothetical protein
VRANTWSSAPGSRRPALRSRRPRLHALDRAQSAVPRPDHAAAAQGRSGREPTPYPPAELSSLAAQCTEQEDDADKVERLVRKAAAALLLEKRIGRRFDGVVTGASEKGTWVRIFEPPAEGKLVHGFDGLEVGNKLRVKLISTDVERGFIDFVRVN